MNRYRICFDDYTTPEYLETGVIQHSQEYSAATATQALRAWRNEHWGYQADSIQKLPAALEDK